MREACSFAACPAWVMMSFIWASFAGSELIFVIAFFMCLSPVISKSDLIELSVPKRCPFFRVGDKTSHSPVLPYKAHCYGWIFRRACAVASIRENITVGIIKNWYSVWLCRY